MFWYMPADLKARIIAEAVGFTVEFGDVLLRSLLPPLGDGGGCRGGAYAWDSNGPADKKKRAGELSAGDVKSEAREMMRQFSATAWPPNAQKASGEEHSDKADEEGFKFPAPYNNENL
eukprot:gene43971-53758_t